MKRLAVLGFALSFAAGVLAQPRAPQAAPSSRLIDASQLLRDLQVLSSDDMQGRQLGTPGGEKARAYVADRFAASGLLPFGDTYAQPFTFASGRSGTPTERRGVNVIGRIDGARTSQRYIVISAHYDHVGVRGGQVFNGADDNASGTAALFALGRYFSAHRPSNSLIFAALDGEEAGLRGAQAFVKSPPVEAASIAIDLNMDMIGRDPNDRLFVVGTRQQPFLAPFIERVAATAPVKLVMGHDDPANRDVEDWTRDSDHYAFCQAKIPCLYFGVEDFDQHHRATDDYETITYGFYVRATETMVRVVEEFDRGLDALAAVRGARVGLAGAGAGLGLRGGQDQAAATAAVEEPNASAVEIPVAGGRLAGTLRMPDATAARVPAVLIIAGSGPTDRDGNSAGLPGKNNAYRMLADALAARGVASLRYDKRGLKGSAIEGLKEADLRFETLVDDASAWIALLKKNTRITTVTVVGHSEGSLIGMLAARAGHADGFVSVAGVARAAPEVLRDQLRPQLTPVPALWEASEHILEALQAGTTVDTVPAPLAALYRPSVQPYLISWFKYIPSIELSHLDIPVLILQGTTDIQVMVGEARALYALKPDARLVIVDGMNHVLKMVPADRAQQLASYSDPTLPIAREVPATISDFVRSLK